MPKSKRVEFRVSFLLPEGALVRDAKAYVIDAVHTMNGCYRPPGSYDDNDPGDPMWGLERESIEVKVARKKDAA